MLTVISICYFFFSGCHQLFVLAMAQSEASEVGGKRSRENVLYIVYMILFPTSRAIFRTIFFNKNEAKTNPNPFKQYVMYSLSIFLWLNLLNVTLEWIFTIFRTHFVFKMILVALVIAQV